MLIVWAENAHHRQGREEEEPEEPGDQAGEVEGGL